VSDKIKPHHVERKAILYVRQSSAYQVQNNLESQKLQYAMRDRLCSLGWRDIEVVDEDLGRTASGAVTRVGFERMVAEVCLGHVGAVAAREVSRFARNARCQPTTVSGLTIMRTSAQRDQHWRMAVQKMRSRRFNCGRGRLRFSTASCCRRARISRALSPRV
jgi:hypothetical protein